MKNMLTSVAAIVLLSSGVVLAADQPGTGPRVACKPDVDRLCPGIQPGGGRIVACLKQNDAQLSAACKEAIAKAREKNAPPPPATPGG
jgi:Cysteine rich repeat